MIVFIPLYGVVKQEIALNKDFNMPIADALRAMMKPRTNGVRAKMKAMINPPKGFKQNGGITESAYKPGTQANIRLSNSKDANLKDTNFAPSEETGVNGFMPSSDKQFAGGSSSGKLTDPLTGREIKETPDMKDFQGVEHQKADPPDYKDLKDTPAQAPNGAWNTPAPTMQNPKAGNWGDGYKSSDDTLKRMSSGPINNADVKSLADDIKADPKILEQKNARGNTIIDRVNNNPELTSAQRKEIQASLPADQQGKIEIEQEDYSKTITRSQADIDRDKAINDGLIKSSDY